MQDIEVVFRSVVRRSVEIYRLGGFCLFQPMFLALFSGADGLDLIRRFIPEAFSRLKPGGWLVLEIGHDQASQVAGFLQDHAFTAIEVNTDLSGVARFPFAKRPEKIEDRGL